LRLMPFRASTLPYFTLRSSTSSRFIRGHPM
jgi:hypothetical protein